MYTTRKGDSILEEKNNHGKIVREEMIPSWFYETKNSKPIKLTPELEIEKQKILAEIMKRREESKN